MWSIEQLQTATGIDPEQLVALRALNRKINNNPPALSAEELVAAQGVLASSIGNMDINTRLQDLRKTL